MSKPLSSLSYYPKTAAEHSKREAEVGIRRNDINCGKLDAIIGSRELGSGKWKSEGNRKREL